MANTDKRTVTEQVYDKLKEAEFDVYVPGQHKGDCTSEYVVVQDAGNVNTTNLRVKTKTFNILCYVPSSRYFDLEYFTEKVIDTLRELYPMIIETGNENPPYFDESVNGWMTSIEYENYRQIKYFE